MNLGSEQANRQHRAALLALVIQRSMAKLGIADAPAQVVANMTDSAWDAAAREAGISAPSADTREAVVELFAEIESADEQRVA
jgi:hypothetical protein